MNGWVTIGAKLDTKSFDKQIAYLEKKLDDVEATLEMAREDKTLFSTQEIEEMELEVEKLNNQLVGLYRKQVDINKMDFSNVSKGITNIIKKVGKWTIAVFGLRSAYNLVRNAVSTIAGDDEQLKADIDYIKNVIAYALEPVVRKIVALAQQLLLVVGYLIYKWFKYDIFANANKNMQKTVGGAKELRKILAGFDEMNVLNEDGSVGVGGAMPSFIGDYSSAEQQVNSIKNKITDLKKQMDDALYNTDFSIWTIAFGEWDQVVYGFTQTINGLWGMVDGMIGTFTGLWHTIHGLVTNDTEETKNGFEQLYNSIGGWIKSTVETITGLKNIISGVAKAIVQGVWGWLTKFINDSIEAFNKFRNNVGVIWVNLGAKIRDTISNLQNWLTEKFGTMGTKIGEVIGSSFKAVINSVLYAIEQLINKPVNAINGLIDTINDVPGINLDKLNNFYFPRLAKGGIINMPGRGVPVGSAIGGERGQEGVIPLTDSQQMALLGEAIGKYININATVPVYVGNRLVIREMKRINAEDNFAYNR